METADFVLWAVRQHPSGSRAVGEHAAVRVLVALCTYANERAEAWPSLATLAYDVDMPVRTVRAALDVLRDSGLIAPAESPRVGRVTRWRIAATSRDIPHGRDAATPRGTSRGTLQGTSRGTLRDIPHRREGNGTEEKGALAPARTCTRHPDWNHGERCRRCGEDRLAAEAYEAGRRPATMSEAAAPCITGHSFDPVSGYCARCEVRDDAA
ncbi:helix-turn-helix domain-containing protein [Microbacterium sp. HJ5]